MLPRVLPAFLLLPFLAACGGNVVVDPTASPMGAGGASTSASTGPVTASSSGVGGTTGAGGAGSCPLLSPNTGEPCASPGLVCNYPGNCCHVPAVCMNGAWFVTVSQCDGLCTACPGTIGCSPQGVCVLESTGAHCGLNPCMGAPVDCSCAGSLCAPGVCDGVSAGFLSCN